MKITNSNSRQQVINSKNSSKFTQNNKIRNKLITINNLCKKIAIVSKENKYKIIRFTHRIAFGKLKNTGN